MNADKADQIHRDALMDCAFGALIDEINEQQAKVDRLQSELPAAQEKLSELHEAREEMGYLDDEEEPGNLVGVELEPGVLGPLSGSVHLTLVKPEDPCTMEQMTRFILQQIVAAADPEAMKAVQRYIVRNRLDE